MSEKSSIVFATENPSKITSVRKFANLYDIDVLMPSEAGFVPLEVEETGDTYQENARLKVEAYLGQEAAKHFIICGDDTGIEITALNGQPGIHTRRWKDGVTRMTDDEIVAYALKELDGVKDRSATFYSTVAFSRFAGPIEYATGSLAGTIAAEPFTNPESITEGAPFRQLFIVDGTPPLPDWQFSQMTIEERGGRLKHREAAFAALFAAIRNGE